jgi:hypothetical protein
MMQVAGEEKEVDAFFVSIMGWIIEKLGLISR